MQAPDKETLSRFGWTDKKEIRIPGRMYRSKAYIELSDTSKYVLGLFMQRRTWYMEGKGRNTRRVFQTQGLMFSYREAEQVWKINRRTFRDSIKQLIRHGFLRIENPGKGGTFKGTRVPTIYMLVDNWQHYGTDLFIKPEIPSSVCFNDNLKRINAARKGEFSREPNLTRQVSRTSPERAKRAI